MLKMLIGPTTEFEHLLTFIAETIKFQNRQKTAFSVYFVTLSLE